MEEVFLRDSMYEELNCNERESFFGDILDCHKSEVSANEEGLRRLAFCEANKQ